MRQDTREALDRWASGGVPTGGFLYAVLTNDLMEAVTRADGGNLACLLEICLYIYNELPSGCWGSKEKVARWLAGRSNVFV